MEQKWAVFAPSCGRVSSWNSRAVTGSSERLNWSSQRNSKRALLSALSRYCAPGWPFARSAACAGDLVGDHAVLYVLLVRQAEVFFGRDVTQHRAAIPADHRRADAAGEVIVAGRDVGGERPERVERSFVAPLELLGHVLLDQVHGHVARPLVHHLHAPGPRALGEFALHLEFGELRLVVGVGNRAGTQTVADAEGRRRRRP